MFIWQYDKHVFCQKNMFTTLSSYNWVIHLCYLHRQPSYSLSTIYCRWLRWPWWCYRLWWWWQRNFQRTVALHMGECSAGCYDREMKEVCHAPSPPPPLLFSVRWVHDMSQLHPLPLLGPIACKFNEWPSFLVYSPRHVNAAVQQRIWIAVCHHQHTARHGPLLCVWLASICPTIHPQQCRHKVWWVVP